MYLTSRLYPCGECAAEFQELLKKFPPQVSTISYPVVIAQLLIMMLMKRDTDFGSARCQFMVRNPSTYLSNTQARFVCFSGCALYTMKSMHDLESQTLTVPSSTRHTIVDAGMHPFHRLQPPPHCQLPRPRWTPRAPRHGLTLWTWNGTLRRMKLRVLG